MKILKILFVFSAIIGFLFYITTGFVVKYSSLLPYFPHLFFGSFCSFIVAIISLDLIFLLKAQKTNSNIWYGIFVITGFFSFIIIMFLSIMLILFSRELLGLPVSGPL